MASTGASLEEVSSINPMFFDAFPEMEFDSWLTVGIEQMHRPLKIMQRRRLLEGTDNYWIPNFEAGHIEFGPSTTLLEGSDVSSTTIMQNNILGQDQSIDLV